MLNKLLQVPYVEQMDSAKHGCNHCDDVDLSNSGSDWDSDDS